MIENLPTYIPVVFALTTIATLILFYLSVKLSADQDTMLKANITAVVLTMWLTIQGAITVMGTYYSNLMALPPKIMLIGVLPTLLVIAYLFATHNGRKFIDSL